MLDGTGSYFLFYSFHELFYINFICLCASKKYADLIFVWVEQTYFFFQNKQYPCHYFTFSKNNFCTFLYLVTWSSIYATFHDHLIHDFKFLVILLIDF